MDLTKSSEVLFARKDEKNQQFAAMSVKNIDAFLDLGLKIQFVQKWRKILPSEDLLSLPYIDFRLSLPRRT